MILVVLSLSLATGIPLLIGVASYVTIGSYITVEQQCSTLVLVPSSTNNYFLISKSKLD